MTSDVQPMMFMKRRRRKKYSVIQQTNGKYAVWDNEMDWFAGDPAVEYVDLSHSKAVEAAEML
jgi:hypothetical protein